ncbi:SRPBCC domain-containing protein [Candidatus Woesearchaeota archaeon]|nr:SRPBCC domain-containing protein [Candidatus Woesearchaeota archaeon]
MDTKAVHQKVFFRASPHEIYESLMDSKEHSVFTGDKAVISRRVGGKISVWSGGITGKNLMLVPDKKIVQSWRIDVEGWPAKHYSKVTFSLAKSRQGTTLTFTQTGIPKGCEKDIANGWKQYYWKPMKLLLEG